MIIWAEVQYNQLQFWLHLFIHVSVSHYATYWEYKNQYHLNNLTRGIAQDEGKCLLGLLLHSGSCWKRRRQWHPTPVLLLENPMDGRAWWAAVHRVAKARTQLSDFTFTFMHWRRKWQPTPVFLPGESRDGGAWWAAVYGVTQSRTQLKWLSSSSSCWKQWSNSNTCRLYLAKGYKDSQILSFRSTFLQKCFLEGNIKIRHTNKANQHVIVLWRGCDFQAK